jgi:hypothetical protein
MVLISVLYTFHFEHLRRNRDDPRRHGEMKCHRGSSNRLQVYDGGYHRVACGDLQFTQAPRASALGSVLDRSGACDHFLTLSRISPSSITTREGINDTPVSSRSAALHVTNDHAAQNCTWQWNSYKGSPLKLLVGSLSADGPRRIVGSSRFA